MSEMIEMRIRPVQHSAVRYLVSCELCGTNVCEPTSEQAALDEVHAHLADVHLDEKVREIRSRVSRNGGSA